MSASTHGRNDGSTDAAPRARGRRRTPTPKRGRAGALALAVLLPLAAALAGCDDGALTPPEADAGDLFDRYVAIGNSITAGFQSSGINDSTQTRSYPVFLAQRMGTRHEVPLLSRPGCPAPLVNIFTGARVGGAGPADCAFRSRPQPPLLHNVAVPGAQVVDVLSNVGPETNANALTTLLLGGRTQLEAAAEVEPTFVSVWIGNNDVLGAALSGDPSRITPPAEFASRYAGMLDALETAADEDLRGVLVGVANVAVIPNLSPGAAWWQAEQAGALPPTLDVQDNCAPSGFGGVGESTLVPFAYGFGVLLNLASQGQVVTLDCQDNRDIEERVGQQNVPPQFRGVSILTGAEIAQISGAVAAYNATIGDAASGRGWAFFNPNPTLAALRAAGEIPLFPNTSGADAVERPFGDFFSRDGVHPSTMTHRIVADSLASAINRQFDTDLPVGG